MQLDSRIPPDPIGDEPVTGKPTRPPPGFLFVTCQVDATTAVKRELARRWPDFRLAYSRPGFLTFKLPENHRLLADFDLESVFARAYGFSLGKVVGEEMADLAKRVWEIYGQRPARRVHVWPRDTASPGDHDFEPKITPEAVATGEMIRKVCPNPQLLTESSLDPLTPAKRGDFVLDCVMVEPNQWWVGYHRAQSVRSKWPGGMMPIDVPDDIVSRAWLKMEEAIQWSQLPLATGARCADLGSAPGGTSQALLDRGFHVMGIDPAKMHRKVLEHPRFVHVRQRVSQVRRREFRKIRWLVADMNVAPDYTLDAAEAIVTHWDVNVRGMLLTLKLPDWKLADQVPEYLDRVRGWGFNVVSARQLRYNGQEICLAALRKPFVRKSPKRRVRSAKTA